VCVPAVEHARPPVQATAAASADGVLNTGYPVNGRPDIGVPVPWAYIGGIWGFHLRAAPGGRTRLVVRSRSRSGPPLVARPFGWLLGEPLHFVLQTRQLHNLRTRVGAEP
jgi:hypothetical protein